MNDLLFGMNVSISAARGTDAVRDACRAERSGFDFVSLNDHPATDGPVYEAWTLLCWIAAHTETIAIAPRVLAVPLRLPALVAKSSESLDRLSGGRVILALGSGGSPEELERLGVERASSATRTTGLEEAVRIIRELWSGDEIALSGDVFQVARLRLEPKPARKIPIWLGTFGRRGLRITGALADGWIPSLGYSPEEHLPEMRARVVEAAIGARRSEGDVRCLLNMGVHVGETAAEDAGLVSGSASQVVERLIGFVEMGFRGFNFVAQGDDLETQVRMLGDDVLPEVREFALSATTNR
ncbi:MAG: LLM class flavin-dependent oxidoreductase [Acidimicrobiales bacterium]